MNIFATYFKGQKQISVGESTSLLSDWNSYSQTKDVEVGASGADGSNLFMSGEATGSKVTTGITDIFQSSLKSVSKGVSSGASILPTAESFSIPTGQQLLFSFSFLAAGCVFLLLAFTIFLPVIILSPSKFALSFTLGCLCIMAGFSALRGWKQQLAHMMSKERLPFSAAYMVSVIATLYASLIMKSYVLSLACSGLQMVALLYYILSYFPGGAQGVKFMLIMFYNAIASCFSSLLRR
ncbi:hypothetical protein CEUSTIGMA_g3554.t1 [Chlamydomonas eustigma]|uniref:Vesicle transport protein n=1 Tax=Chlamydomonas eustigma TaxID=1157962 RepID=A0A250WZ50_9CHLO|nr:hypothetical protein CEUSTIGMA_g3554.t1 [Chlamydomonas eustigma]|eukprot:GAX76111.1 hypothetical protein CEUSTIGMA_g3554.t1 [Chlamydomonas eustigma]